MDHACVIWGGAEKIVTCVLKRIKVPTVMNVNVVFGSRWKAVRNVTQDTWIHLLEHATNANLPGKQKPTISACCVVDVCQITMVATVNMLIQLCAKQTEIH